MEPRHLIRAAIVVSVVGHLLLAAGLILADAQPFEPVPSESIAVDIVTPAEAPQAPETTPAPEPPKPPDPFRLPELSYLDHQAQQAARQAAPEAASSQPAAPQGAPPPAQPPPPQQQAQTQPQATAPQASAQPPASPDQPPVQQQAGPPAVQPAPAAPEPDITVKYGVMLGLPDGDGIGAAAFAKADIAPVDTAAFRRHLKSCSTLPGSVAAGDKVRIVLRAYFAPDGRLAGPPTLLEASASAKGPALMQAAISALQACQPYAMLPAAKYKEWKILDLVFSPQDFTGG
ncbi:hypothetical protein ONR75_14925 [Rhodopseudomonas sp. P2A-2r]|nr:hypothetical protein ONR75_14925 [Rhodopseudomonas sp. P2A-2r]